MTKQTYRILTRGADGSIRVKEYSDQDTLAELHPQIGVEDSSTDLSLRGLPVFRGLIGPIPEAEDKQAVRYESPEVFETLTKEWSTAKPERKTRRRSRGSKPASLTNSKTPNANA
jgi:hypothetical protein